MNTRQLGTLGLVALLGALVVTSLPSAAGKEKDDRILLQIYFQVAAEKTSKFEAMYRDVYVPAMRKQKGYIGSNLLRLYPDEVSKGIQAAPTDYNYQMELVFDTELNRTKWVASKEHAEAWPIASALAKKAAWRGYDVLSSDHAGNKK